ncbi:histidine kinase [Kitasatospora aburaviensis]
MPAGTTVRVTAETGGVRLSGLAGEVEATVSTGGVEASGLTSPTALLRSDTGGIEASFAAAPAKVEARAGTGGVRLRVPAGDAYAVDASAGTGGVDVAVPRQPGRRAASSPGPRRGRDGRAWLSSGCRACCRWGMIFSAGAVPPGSGRGRGGTSGAVVGQVGRGNPYLLDVPLAVFSFAVSLWSVRNDDTDWPWWVYAMTIGTALPLPWRRRAPLTVAALSGLASIPVSVVAHSVMPQIPVYAVVSIYTVADRARDWQRRLLLGVLVVSNILGTHSVNGAFFSLLLTIGTFVFGSLVRELRRLARVEADRALEAGRRAASDAARAVVEERARIAREMHDILAHAVSLMVIQAEAGPLVVRDNPDRAIRAFDDIAGAGRDAMVQLRRVLGVLKEDGAAPELAPQPRLAELPALAERVRSTGPVVELEVDATAGPLPAEVEAAAYRIVQEALTNTVKHAEASRVEVRVVRAGRSCRSRWPTTGAGCDCRRSTWRAAGPAGGAWSASGNGRWPAAAGPRPGRGRAAGVSW